MLSLLIQSLYNIVDSIFVAQLSETALTAASLVYAIQFLMIAIGVGTAVGLNALLSRKLGQKKPEEACRAATTGLFLMLGTSLVFTLLGLFSASDEMLAFGVPALRIISVTFLFVVTTILCGYFASGLGNGVVNMIGGALRQLGGAGALPVAADPHYGHRKSVVCVLGVRGDRLHLQSVGNEKRTAEQGKIRQNKNRVRPPDAPCQDSQTIRSTPFPAEASRSVP